MEELKLLLLEIAVVLGVVVGGVLAFLLASVPFSLYFQHRMDKQIAARERDERDRLAQANQALAQLMPAGSNDVELKCSVHHFYRAYDVQGLSLKLDAEDLQLMLNYNVREDGALDYSDLELRSPCCGEEFRYDHIGSSEDNDLCACDKCGKIFEEQDWTLVLYDDEVPDEPAGDWRAFVHNEEDFCAWVQTCSPAPLEPLELFMRAETIYSELLSVLYTVAEASKPGGKLHPLLHSW